MNNHHSVEVVLARQRGDHATNDSQWYSFTTIIAPDPATGKAALAWERRYGGQRDSPLSRLGQDLLRSGHIGEASYEIAYDPIKELSK